MTITPNDGAAMNDLRQLVIAAYTQAYDRGKPDWPIMRLPVLKNRMLQMTNRTFDADAFGGGSFRSLMLKIPDMLAVHDNDPITLELLQPQLVTGQRNTDKDPPGPTGSRVDLPVESRTSSMEHVDWRDTRIRSDLWRAILGYDSRDVYIWDSSQSIARPREVIDESDQKSLPTLGLTDLLQWRRDFVRSAAAEAAGQELLQRWVASGLTADLPRRLQGLWLEWLKRRTYERITAWFNAERIPLPSDLLLRVRSKSASVSEVNAVIRTQRLRSLIIDTLSRMSYDELAALRLPASALLLDSDRRHE